MSRRWYVFALLAATLASPAFARADAIEIKPGDHICIIGNTLADRMQHDGWLETYLQARFPEHKLVIRNLGFSGDELTLRLRSANFGTPDHWLTRTKADVSSPSSATTSRSPARKGWPSSRRISTVHQAYAGAEVQRQVGPAAGPVLADRPRDLRDRNLPDGIGQQRAAQALHRRDGRGGQGQRRRLRRPVHADAWRSVRQGRRAAHDQRRSSERARQPASRRRSSTGAVLRRPSRSATPRRWRSSARPSSTRTSTGSTATARSTATRSTAAGPTCSSSTARPTAWSPSARWKSST